MDQPDDGRCLVRPKGLEAAQVGVLATGEVAVESFEEYCVRAVMVIDAGVVVIAKHYGERDAYLGLLCGVGQAIQKVVVGLVIGAQEVSAPGAASGDHVRAAGDDLSGK